MYSCKHMLLDIYVTAAERTLTTDSRSRSPAGSWGRVRTTIPLGPLRVWGCPEAPITQKVRYNGLCRRRGPEARARARASGPGLGLGPGPGSGPRARTGGKVHYNAVSALLEPLGGCGPDSGALSFLLFASSAVGPFPGLQNPSYVDSGVRTARYCLKGA